MKCEQCGYDDHGTGDTAHVCSGYPGNLWRPPRIRFVGWIAMAELRRPKMPNSTYWFDGTTHLEPERTGSYERHFTASSELGDATMQWWDGALWRVGGADGLPHWRQVGDYPAWRGLAHDPEAGRSAEV